MPIYLCLTIFANIFMPIYLCLSIYAYIKISDKYRPVLPSPELSAYVHAHVLDEFFPNGFDLALIFQIPDPLHLGASQRCLSTFQETITNLSQETYAHFYSIIASHFSHSSFILRSFLGRWVKITCLFREKPLGGIA